MKLRVPSVLQITMVAASIVAFVAGGHFAANGVIARHQTTQLHDLTDVALRRSEAAVDFAATTLHQLARRGSPGCDPASLQAVRLHVYQRSAIKDIRLVNRDGSIVCSAYSETLEFDNGWAERSDMLRSQDQRTLLFRVDQINGIALGVLEDLDDRNSLVAILGIDSGMFDIMPAELRAHSDVSLELTSGSEVGQFSQKPRGELLDAVSFANSSSRYPIRATVRIERSIFQHWSTESYWPAMLIAAGLGLVFGLLLTRATAKIEGPIAEIDRGLARREFKPFYQPTFDLRTGAVRGCEILARWMRSDGTVVPPMQFIPLAETSGRIEAMTWQILETALSELQSHLREDKYFKVSVNVAPHHLLSDGFIEVLRRVVAGSKVSARQIVLEVTERAELADLNKAAAVVMELREFGFRVAMDDVGVGHSGLSQMKALGANIIKIDKYFVDTINEDGAAATIIGTLVRLARDLGMTVIAEGVETGAQVEALVACGVEEGQGYLVSPPLPFPKFEEFLAQRRAQANAEDDARSAARVA
ncbi:MAG TPA: EAL domain-containing protein [Bradyrhizobium sp.]|nr:EAL domain-containing protein [Bradyrhizobium sp.]